MEGIFIGVLCLSGCLTFSTCLLHQYHFVSDVMNWTEAQSYCREKYTDLANIENTEEMKKLNDTVSAAGNSSEVWIGLYSHIDWKWIFFCYRAVKTLVKMRVKLEDSSLDLNDPAVKQQILKQASNLVLLNLL
ncbi:unnamed protein product [Pleuronectes platessa]|uniref:C-type lectin domain-containing protein n=1 Tax=Pleuronectes platessa TaxID=8262 RepID=A0A9N7YR61_PLEPL|nr:unnamed protein product [Pleuronectes platessa]